MFYNDNAMRGRPALAQRSNERPRARPTRAARTLLDDTNLRYLMYQLMIYFINFCLCINLDNPAIRPITGCYLSMAHLWYSWCINTITQAPRDSHALLVWCLGALGVSKKRNEIWANINSAIYDIDILQVEKKNMRKFSF